MEMSLARVQWHRNCPKSCCNQAMTPEPILNVEQLLAFYLEAGVDCALGEEPVNRLADPDVAPSLREAAPVPSARPVPAPAPIVRA